MNKEKYYFLSVGFAYAPNVGKVMLINAIVGQSSMARIRLEL